MKQPDKDGLAALRDFYTVTLIRAKFELDANGGMENGYSVMYHPITHQGWKGRSTHNRWGQIRHWPFTYLGTVRKEYVSLEEELFYLLEPDTTVSEV